MDSYSACHIRPGQTPISYKQAAAPKPDAQSVGVAEGRDDPFGIELQVKVRLREGGAARHGHPGMEHCRSTEKMEINRNAGRKGTVSEAGANQL